MAEIEYTDVGYEVARATYRALARIHGSTFTDAAKAEFDAFVAKREAMGGTDAVDASAARVRMSAFDWSGGITASSAP